MYNLTNGKMYNLETMHRYGDSSVSYENATLEVQLEVEVENLKVLKKYTNLIIFFGQI